MRKKRWAPTASRLVSSLALAAAVLGFGPTAASAADVAGPSMVLNQGITYIAIEGPYNSLMLYYAPNGSSNWRSEQIAGPGTTFSAPSLVQYENFLYIAVQGADNQLIDYFDVIGSGAWQVYTVAGVNTTYSAPSLILNQGRPDISAEGAGSELKFYSLIPGTSDSWST